MTSAKSFTTAPGVRLREEVDGRVLVYFEENGFETNAVGAWLIELARVHASSIEHFCESVCVEFDAPIVLVRSDVEKVVAEFVQIGILLEQTS